MKCAVIVATTGRPDLVSALLSRLSAQTALPCEVVISAVNPEDLPGETPAGMGFPVTTTLLARGAAAQRNAGLDALTTQPDIVAFLDDDSVPRDDYIAATITHFDRHPESSAVSGTVALEGSDGHPPLTDQDIALALERSRHSTPGPALVSGDLYGCTMNFRSEIVDTFRFDTRLPLYSLFEDLDLSARMTTAGLTIYRDPAIVIVHRKDPSGGRLAGERFGYSWVMNWEYLRRQGSVKSSSVARIATPVAKNAVLGLVGRQRHTRRARLRGNLLALADIARGRITPGRITEMS